MTGDRLRVLGLDGRERVLILDEGARVAVSQEHAVGVVEVLLEKPSSLLSLSDQGRDPLLPWDAAHAVKAQTPPMPRTEMVAMIAMRIRLFSVISWPFCRSR